MAPILMIIDKDSVCIGKLEARVGLHTYAGVISKVSEKSIWVIGRDGTERLFRSGVERPPSLPLYRLRKADRLRAGLILSIASPTA